MRVRVLWRSDPERPLTDPLPERNGIVLRFYAGDFCHPILRAPDWFHPPWPERIIRRTLSFMPFIAWKIGPKGGYLGFKLYGVDSEAYLNWPGYTNAEVFPGSQACHFSFRPFASIPARS